MLATVRESASTCSKKRRTWVQAPRRSKIGPGSAHRAAARLDPCCEETHLPVFGIQSARGVDPLLCLEKIAARLGEQRELLERCGRPRFECAGAKGGVTGLRRLAVEGMLPTLVQRETGEERNELEHHDGEGESC